MVKTQWELAEISADRTDFIKKYLDDNWEPFAVTATRVNIGCGTSRSSEKVWFRRITKKEVTGDTST